MNHDCACLYNEAYGDLPAFHRVTQVRARKSHRCVECREVIPAGAVYERFAGKWEQGVSAYKTCLPCCDVRASLYCEGWTFGQLWEDVEEQIFREGGLTIACVEKCATVDGKAKLQQAYMDWVQR